MKAWSSKVRRTQPRDTMRSRRLDTCTASTSISPISTSLIPEVSEEIEKVIGFWLQLGVSGFRLEAAPFPIEYRGLPTDQ